MAVNDQYKGEFMPGISAGAPNLAPGTPGASGQAADSAGTTVTPPWGGYQDRYPASTGGTVEPGQSEPTAISPGPAEDYTDTDAGSGHAGHFPRRPWQQSGGA